VTQNIKYIIFFKTLDYVYGYGVYTKNIVNFLGKKIMLSHVKTLTKSNNHSVIAAVMAAPGASLCSKGSLVLLAQALVVPG
jgi:hypothetical protein